MEVIDKTKTSIVHKASELKIKQLGDYTAADDKFITDNYETKTIREIAKLINRPESGVTSRASRLRLRKIKSWSKDEIKIIKKYYPKNGIQYVIDNFLHHRTWNAINGFVSKFKIVRVNKDSKWFSKKSLLTDLKDLSKKIGRSPRMKDLKEYNLHHPKTYERYFGSYTSALDLAGLPLNSSLFGKSVKCYSLNNDRCDSGAEQDITNFL